MSDLSTEVPTTEKDSYDGEVELGDISKTEKPKLPSPGDLEAEIRLLKNELDGSPQSSSIFYKGLRKELRTAECELDKIISDGNFGTPECKKQEEKIDNLEAAIANRKARLAEKEALLLTVAKQPTVDASSQTPQNHEARAVKKDTDRGDHVGKEFPWVGWLLYKATAGMIDNPKMYLANLKQGDVKEYFKLVCMAIYASLIVAVNNLKNTFTTHATDKPQTLDKPQTPDQQSPRIKC